MNSDNTFYTIPAILLNHLSTSTVKRIEEDMKKFKEKVVNELSILTQTDFDHLFINQKVRKKLPEDLRREFENIHNIREQAQANVNTLNTRLAILNVRSNIDFKDDWVVRLNAFFGCLPDYFQSESFLKELLEDEMPDKDFDYKLLSQDIMETRAFKQKNKLTPEEEQVIMFFVGTQLINDIF